MRRQRWQTGGWHIIVLCAAVKVVREISTLRSIVNRIVLVLRRGSLEVLTGATDETNSNMFSNKRARYCSYANWRRAEYSERPLRPTRLFRGHFGVCLKFMSTMCVSVPHRCSDQQRSRFVRRTSVDNMAFSVPALPPLAWRVVTKNAFVRPNGVRSLNRVRCEMFERCGR